MKIAKILLSLSLCAVLAACSTDTNTKEMDASKTNEQPIQIQASEYVPKIVNDISIGDNTNSYKPFLYKDGRMVVFLPSSVKNNLHIFSESKTIFKNTEINNDTVLTGINDNGVYPFKNKDYNTEIVFRFTKNLKTLDIKTESGGMQYLEENKKHKEKAEFALKDKDGNSLNTLPMKMKGRGNSSWYGSIQKSFNLTLDEKTSLFGNKPCKKYSMLANWNIPTRQLKNALAFKLGQDLKLEFTPVGEFMDVYVNGAYQGLYFLTTTKDLKSTVDIHNLEKDNEKISEEPKKFVEKKKGKEMVGYDYPSEPENISGGYLLEFDKRYKDEDSYFENKTTPIVVKSPELASRAELDYISKFYYEIEKDLLNNSNLSDKLDVESWVKDCLLQEFVVNTDVELSSLFAYKKQDIDKLFAGPIWDFDRAFGYQLPEVTTQTLWIKDGYSKLFKAMMNSKAFDTKVQNLYQKEFSAYAKNLAEDYLPNLAKDIKPSVEMNAIRWASEFETFDKDVENLQNWILKRRAFYDDYYKNPNSYSKILLHFDSYDVSYMVKTKTKLEKLPISNMETSAGEDRTVTGFKTKDGKKFNENTVIDKDIELYPVYKK